MDSLKQDLAKLIKEYLESEGTHKFGNGTYTVQTTHTLDGFLAWLERPA